MARYKRIYTSPRFIAVDLQRQLLPGTFEHALNHLIDREPIRLSPQAGKSLFIPNPPPQGGGDVIIRRYGRTAAYARCALRRRAMKPTSPRPASNMA